MSNMSSDRSSWACSRRKVGVNSELCDFIDAMALDKDVPLWAECGQEMSSQKVALPFAKMDGGNTSFPTIHFPSFSDCSIYIHLHGI